MDQPMPTADYRSVRIETLREHFQEQVEITSLRAVAQRAGVGRTTLFKFLRGATTPHPRVKRALALLYLGNIGQGRGRVTPCTVGEQWERPEVQLAARVLVETFRQSLEPVPDWLSRLAK